MSYRENPPTPRLCGGRQPPGIHLPHTINRHLLRCVSINSVPNGARVIKAESKVAAFVILHCMKEFFISFWVKRKCHIANRCRILANTSSPGIGWTLPDRNSCRRRFATAAHFSSISESVGFRERSRESTIRVLSSTGSDSASCIISAVLCMIITSYNFARRLSPAMGQFNDYYRQNVTNQAFRR